MISCDQHDYIEIACMYRFQVKLELTSGEIIHGTAVEPTYNEQKEECLKLKLDTNELVVVVDEIKSMEAITKNPHFDVITFISSP